MIAINMDMDGLVGLVGLVGLKIFEQPTQYLWFEKSQLNPIQTVWVVLKLLYVIYNLTKYLYSREVKQK